MTMYPYVELANSNASLRKKFKVPMGSWISEEEKRETRRRTVTAKSATQLGGIVARHTFTAKVRNVSSGSDPDGSTYGVLADLRTLFRLRDPNGTPNNRITYYDNLGVSHVCEWYGVLTFENLTPVIEGNNSWFYVPVTLEEVSPI